MKLVMLLIALPLAACSASDERTRCIDRGGRAIYEVISEDEPPVMVQCMGMRGVEG